MNLQLPKVLEAYESGLQTALEQPLIADWPEHCRVLEAPQAEAIGRLLVEVIHQHLLGHRIAYLFIEDKAAGEKVVLGTMKKASAELNYFADYDFVMHINWSQWKIMPNEARIALVDHELCHAGIDEKGKCVILQHDVEEFGIIVRRWGLWKNDLKWFAETAQLELVLS